MKFRNHLSPEQNLQRFIHLQMAKAGEPAGEFSTWLLTGTAAIVGAVIVNIDPISKVMGASNLRWGLALLVGSMLCGAVVRQLCLMLRTNVQLSEELYEALTSEESMAVFQQTSMPVEQLNKEISGAYLPPMRWLISRSFNKGALDPIANEKSLAKLVSIAAFVYWGQALAAFVGLMTLGLGTR